MSRLTFCLTYFSLLAVIFLEIALLELDNNLSFTPNVNQNLFPTQPNKTPSLLVQNGQVLQRETNKSIVLKGALSDYFRGGFFSKRDTEFDIQELIYTTNKLKQHGINIIGFYLSDPNFLQKHITELDHYIDYAKENSIYVYLMPVARDFDSAMQKLEAVSVVRQGNYDELRQLIDLLASRYKDYSNVLYGFGAEPSGPPFLTQDQTKEVFDAWNRKQRELAQIVRSYNPNAILLITNPLISFYYDNPFPLENIIYFNGGYSAYDAEGARKHPNEVEARRQWIINCLPVGYPRLIGEFGGLSSGDFSSPLDLEITQKILEDIHKNNLNYTAYKLSPTYEQDTLSLFDMKGNLTKKGQLYAKYFSM